MVELTTIIQWKPIEKQQLGLIVLLINYPESNNISIAYYNENDDEYRVLGNCMSYMNSQDIRTKFTHYSNMQGIMPYSIMP